MKIDFTSAMMAGFFGFVTLLLLVGLLPPLEHLFYKPGQSFGRRLAAPIVSAMIAGLILILPVLLTDLVTGFIGAIIVIRFLRQTFQKKHDVV